MSKEYTLPFYACAVNAYGKRLLGTDNNRVVHGLKTLQGALRRFSVMQWPDNQAYAVNVYRGEEAQRNFQESARFTVTHGKAGL